MKKLISVFAALALVGSLAAQKKPAAKAPAKPAAPAAPAIAAPAAPAIAAPAAVPAPGASGKGMGLFIEGRGSFTVAVGTSDAKQDGDVSQAGFSYKLSGPTGFGGGASIGYEIANNIGLVASFDYRSIKTREYSVKNTSANTLTGGNVPAGTADYTAQRTTNTMILGLGIRPTVAVWGGNLYAGAGFAYQLPYSYMTTTNMSNFTASSGLTIKNEDKYEWNAGIGAYGELGYQFPVTDMIYVGVGARLFVLAATNDGKSRTSTSTTSTGTTTTTTTEYSSTQAAGKSSFSSDGTTDIAANVTVGVRF